MLNVWGRAEQRAWGGRGQVLSWGPPCGLSGVPPAAFLCPPRGGVGRNFREELEGILYEQGIRSY